MFICGFFFSSKIHPACHSDANGIKPGSNQKMTDKNAAELGRNLIPVRCKNRSYNNITRSIGLLDKIVIFVCTDKFSYK